MKNRLLLPVLVFLTATAFTQTTPFRFAWLSDTHVGSATGAEDLRRSIDDINAMPDVAFVIISGDVTETGSDTELMNARSLLGMLKKPWYAVPGNHDTKWSPSGCTTFPKLFGNDRFVFEHHGFCFIGLHQGPRMRMGDAHWAPEDMRWLDSTLALLPDIRQPLFFVTHYPVDSSISNWFVMLDRAKRFNTQAILHGHGHRNRVSDFEGIVGIMGRSNLRAADSVGGYTLAEIRNDSLYVYERRPGVETRPAWHSMALGMREYGKRAFPRPPDTLSHRYPKVQIVWRKHLQWTIASAPAVAGNSVYVSDASGAVRSLRLTDGKELWRFVSRGPVFSTPLTARQRIVFGSADSAIYCLDSRSGKQRWRVRTGSAVVASPVTDGVRVFIGASDDVFRSIHLMTGKLLWEYAGLEGFVETRPARAGGKIIFGAWDQHLYALKENNGELAWKWKGDGNGVLLSPAACEPVVANGRVYIVAPDRKMTALDLESGKTVWRTAAHQVRESIGISEDKKRVYVRTLRDSIIALGATTDSLRYAWITDAEFGYDHNYAALVERGGTLYYGTRYGRLLALDARTGALRWQVFAGPALINTVAPVDGKRVVITTAEGEVMLVQER